MVYGEQNPDQKNYIFNSLYPENVLNTILSVKQLESYLNSF